MKKIILLTALLVGMVSCSSDKDESVVRTMEAVCEILGDDYLISLTKVEVEFEVDGPNMKRVVSIDPVWNSKYRLKEFVRGGTFEESINRYFTKDELDFPGEGPYYVTHQAIGTISDGSSTKTIRISLSIHQ
ncbi:hypothetical protein [Bacteroides sp. 51]|uniref:hypothetical protein n=1 Tax=Bacteroides sp. 51 TaxID=2302938 RepID=UPI0013D84025|nr:hypothetical protein [Bacteroides sp. 51]NDV84807.1 hypothetical protein [Bacteroides sp. 51]